MTTAAVFIATYVAAFLAGVWHDEETLWPWAGLVSLAGLALSIALAVSS